MRLAGVEILREERPAVVDQRVGIRKRLKVVAALLELDVGERRHLRAVGVRLLRPPPFRRGEAREEERMRTEHEVDLRKLRGQLQVHVRMLQERRQRQAVRIPVDGVVRTEDHATARAHMRPHRREPVHLAVPDGARARGERRIPRHAHRARRLVRDEIAPGERDVREKRRLLLVREEQPAVAVVDDRDQRPA